MKRFFLSLVLLMSSAHAGLIPIAARYDGAGGVFGLGYEQSFGKNKILLGGVTGDANAYGGLFTHYLNQNVEFSLGFVSFSDIALLTTYERGLADDVDNQYILNLEGQAVAIGTKIWMLSDYMTFGFSGTQSTIKFDKYQTTTGIDIELPEANLFDIETTDLKLALDFNFYDNPRNPRQGVGLNVSLNSLSGRTGQSDQQTLNYGIKGIVPIASHFSFAAKARFSDALVSVNEKYDTDTEVRDALEANCSTASTPNQQALCQNLENALVDYIVRNNNVGSATPLGGSGGLRSFREQRFKAAHTALYTAEFTTNLSSLLGVLKGKESGLGFVVFYDQGFASDDKLTLMDESKYSQGFSLVYSKGQGAIRLQAASGSDNSSSWSLGAGRAF